MSDETTRKQLNEILADVLGCDENELLPGARFSADLGGESIDLLELSFQCKKQFGVDLDVQKAFPPDRFQMDESGRPTPESIAFLRGRFPSWDVPPTNEWTKGAVIVDFLTVDVLYQILRSAMLAREGAAEIDNGPSPITA